MHSTIALIPVFVCTIGWVTLIWGATAKKQKNFNFFFEK
jgi:hypothetical protein